MVVSYQAKESSRVGFHGGNTSEYQSANNVRNDEERQAWCRSMWEGVEDTQPEGQGQEDDEVQEEDGEAMGDDFDDFAEGDNDEDFGDFDDVEQLTPMPTQPQPPPTDFNPPPDILAGLVSRFHERSIELTRLV